MGWNDVIEQAADCALTILKIVIAPFIILVLLALSPLWLPVYFITKLKRK